MVCVQLRGSEGPMEEGLGAALGVQGSLGPLSRAQQLRPKAKKGSRDSRDLFPRISTAGMQLSTCQLSTCQPERSKTGSWATARVCPGSVSSWIVPLTSLVPLTYASCDLRDGPNGFPQTILLRFIVSRPQDMGAIGAAKGRAFIAQSSPTPKWSSLDMPQTSQIHKVVIMQ